MGRVPTKKYISDMFHIKLKLAYDKQEDYMENFVKDVATIYDMILSVLSLAHIIVEQEKRDGQNSL